MPRKVVRETAYIDWGLVGDAKKEHAKHVIESAYALAMYDLLEGDITFPFYLKGSCEEIRELEDTKFKIALEMET